jgi:hypothetical protein
MKIAKSRLVFSLLIIACRGAVANFSAYIDEQPKNEDGNHEYIRKNNIQSIVSNLPAKKIHRISSNNGTLFYDNLPIAPVTINPKDGMQDLPDSVWNGLYIGKIKKLAEKDIAIGTNNVSLIYSSPDDFPYAYAKPLLRSLSEAGVKSILIPVSKDTYVAAELIYDKEEDYIVHSGDTTGYNTIIQIHPNSILLYINSVAKNGNLVLTIPTTNGSQFNANELSQLESGLIKGLSKYGYICWIGIDPHSSIPFKKLTQLLSTINGINEKKELKKGINISLYGVYTPWE